LEEGIGSLGRVGGGFARRGTLCLCTLLKTLVLNGEWERVRVKCSSGERREEMKQKSYHNTNDKQDKGNKHEYELRVHIAINK
jgi:hypothetical protein